MAIEKLGRKEIRDFLDWVYERDVEQEATNPGRTANKAREQLWAIIFWGWKQELIEMPPRRTIRKRQPQRHAFQRCDAIDCANTTCFIFALNA